MLSTKFQLNWPFVSEEQEKNRFSRWQPTWQFWISDRNIVLAIFALQDIPMLPTKFQVSSPFGSGEEVN